MGGLFKISKVEINVDTLVEIDKTTKLALQMATEATLTDILSEQVIPFDTGTMQNDGTKVLTDNINKHGIATIETEAPQAQRLYHHPEYNFNLGKNANAGGKWFDRWIYGDKQDFSLNAFVTIAKRLWGK